MQRRQRTLDRFRRLPVLRDTTTLAFDEEAPTELNQAKKKRLIDLPVPSVSEVADYEQFTARDYAQPAAFIRRTVPATEGATPVDDALAAMADLAADDAPLRPAHYDADSDDLAWIASHARVGAGAPLGSRLSWAGFEFVVDVLEHAAGAGSPPQPSDAPSTVVPLWVKAAAKQRQLVQQPAGPAAATQHALALRLPALAPPAMLSSATGPGPHGLSQLNKLAEDVCRYWLDRRSKLKKPLLRRYWPPTPLTDKNAHHTFRPHERDTVRLRRQTRRNDGDSLRKLRALAEDLAAFSGVMDLVRARELVKQDLVAASADAFEQALAAEVGALPGPPAAPASRPGAGMAAALDSCGDAARVYAANLKRRRQAEEVVVTGLGLLLPPAAAGAMGQKLKARQQQARERRERDAAAAAAAAAVGLDDSGAAATAARGRGAGRTGGSHRAGAAGHRVPGSSKEARGAARDRAGGSSHHARGVDATQPHPERQAAAPLMVPALGPPLGAAVGLAPGAALAAVAAGALGPTGGVPAAAAAAAAAALPVAAGVYVAHPWLHVPPNAASISGSFGLGIYHYVLPPLPAHVVTAPNGAPSPGLFFEHGINKNSWDSGALHALPAALAAERHLIFQPGYRRFTPGAWSLPRTVAPHQAEDVYFEHADPLGLGQAYGMRLGVGVTPVQRDAALVGVGFPVLPSRSPAFPMDTGYAYPAPVPELYRSDVTVQRRMLMAKHLNGASCGGIAWEEGSGSGLVAGIGSGITADGRGWHGLGTHLELSHRPQVHEAYGAAERGVGSRNRGSVAAASHSTPRTAAGIAAAALATPRDAQQEADLARRSFVGGADPVHARIGARSSTVEAEVRRLLGAVSLLDDTAAGDSIVNEQAGSYVARSLSAQQEGRLAARGAVLSSSAVLDTSTALTRTRNQLEDACGEAVSDVLYTDAWLADSSDHDSADGIDESDDVDGEAQVLLAPRIGRGGRIFFDRVSQDSQGHNSIATAAIFRKAARESLRIRNVQQKRARCRNWLQLLAGFQHMLPGPVRAHLVGAGPFPRDPSMAATARLLESLKKRAPVLSSFQLLQGHGYTADPVDAHATHLRLFSHYSNPDGLRCPRSEAAHDGSAHPTVIGSALTGCHQIYAPLATCYLATSRFTRVGDEMLAAVNSAPDDSGPLRWLQEGWDAFFDPVPTSRDTVAADVFPASLFDPTAPAMTIVQSLLPDLAKELSISETTYTNHGKRRRLHASCDDATKDPLSLCSVKADRVCKTSSAATYVDAMPRDADGIPIAGAHSSAAFPKMSVCALNGSRARLPTHKARVIVERSLFSIDDTRFRKFHDIGAPQPVPSESLSCKGIAGNEDRFRDMWMREDDDSDDDSPRFQDLQESCLADDFNQQTVASACFEEAQFQPFVGQLRAEDGT